MTPPLLRLIHSLAAYPGGNYSGPEYFGVRDMHDVSIEYHEIRVLAGRERPKDRFLKPGVRGPDRHRLKSFLARHLLLGIPSASRPVGRVLPCDGSVKGE